MVKPVRFGIVGLGWVARDYMLPAIAAAGDRVRLTAVVSRGADDFVGLPDSVRRFTELDELLATDLVDAVYVATPNHLHEAQSVACLRAGLHVLCEKPLARTRDAVGRMQEAARGGNRLLATAYDQRHHPAHRRMQEWIEAGRLGIITQVRLDYACWLPREWSGDNWRIDPVRAGGGAVIDLAPHGIDLIEWLTGQAVEDVHCYLQSAVQEYAVDDGGVLSLRLAGGALAGLTVAYNRPETLPRRRLEVIGTTGMLAAENTMGQDPGGRLTFHDAGDGSVQTLDFAPVGPFDHQLIDFLDQIAAFNPTSETIQDDLDVTLRHVGLLQDALEQAALPSSSPEPLTA